MDLHIDTIGKLAIEISQELPPGRRTVFDTFVKDHDFVGALRYLRGYDRYPSDPKRFKARLGNRYHDLDYIRANYQTVTILLSKWEVALGVSGEAARLARKDHFDIAV